MKFLWNGDADGTRTFYKNANGGTQRFRVLTDVGDIVDLTGDTTTLEIYADTRRSAAAVASLALNDSMTADELTSGYQLEEFLQAVMTFGPGTYYAFLKNVNGGASLLSTNYFTVVIK